MRSESGSAADSPHRRVPDMQCPEDPGRVPAWRLLPRFVAMDVRLGLARIARRIGIRTLADVRNDALEIPDTRLCRDALALASATSASAVLNHSLRTYAFGSVLAARDRLVLDREVFFVAAVLHDLGLNADLADEPGSFEWVGAGRARAFCAERGVDPDRTRLVHDAIALHSSVGIAHRREPEVALVHFGAGADLLGLRLDDVPPDLLQHILARHPRLAFKQCFAGLLAHQASAKPASHIAGHVQLGLLNRLRTAAFAE